MLNRFIHELNHIQNEYDICGVELFKDWLITHWEIASPDCFTFFSLNVDTLSNEVRLECSNLSLDSLFKLLQFLKIPQKDYKIANYFILKEDLLLEDLLPTFKEAIKNIALFDPIKLKPYQIASKIALEQNAIYAIQQATQMLLEECKDIIYGKNNDVTKKSLVTILYFINGVMLTPQSNDEEGYPFIFVAKNTLDCFIRNTKFTDNRIISLLKCLQRNFVDYEKYNRIDAIKKVKQVFNNIAELFNRFNIDSPWSDVLTLILFQLADIQQLPIINKVELSCFDKTRIQFSFTGLSENAQEKFLKFFKEQGDISIFKKDCYSELEIRFNQLTSAINKKQIFEVDGMILHDKILPLVKEKIEWIAKNHPDQIKPYQKLSNVSNKAIKKEKSTTSTSLGMFCSASNISIASNNSASYKPNF